MILTCFNMLAIFEKYDHEIPSVNRLVIPSIESVLKNPNLLVFLHLLAIRLFIKETQKLDFVSTSTMVSNQIWREKQLSWAWFPGINRSVLNGPTPWNLHINHINLSQTRKGTLDTSGHRTVGNQHRKIGQT